MAHFLNLTEQDLSILKECFESKIQSQNPSAIMKLFPVLPDPIEENHEDRLMRVEEKLDVLNSKIDKIFGDHFLLKGRFTSTEDLKHGKIF